MKCLLGLLALGLANEEPPIPPKSSKDVPQVDDRVVEPEVFSIVVGASNNEVVCISSKDGEQILSV